MKVRHKESGVTVVVNDERARALLTRGWEQVELITPVPLPPKKPATKK